MLENEIKNKIQKAKDLLSSHGYYTGNLWHIDDVKQNYKCSDDDAYQVLEDTLTDDATIEEIYQRIDTICGMLEIKQLNDA